MCCGCGSTEELNAEDLCADCAEAKERAALEEKAREFRYMSREWIAVRPIMQTPMAELMDQKFAEWVKEQEQKEGAA